jgi:DNA-binding MarR family transcriptional regulator
VTTDRGRHLADQLSAIFGLLLRAGETDEISLTARQRGILAELFAAGPLRTGTLADVLGTSDPTISRAIDGLVAAGLVERLPDPHDRRAVVVKTTARGSRRIERRRRAIAGELERALGRLPASERDQLLDLVDRLVAELDRAPSERERRQGALLTP